MTAVMRAAENWHPRILGKTKVADLQKAEKTLEKAVRRSLGLVAEAAAGALEGLALGFQEDPANEALADAFERAMQDATANLQEEFAQTMAGGLGPPVVLGGSAAMSDLPGIDVDWSLSHPEAQQWIREHALGLVQGLTETTITRMREALLTGLGLGESRDDIAVRIRDVVQDVSEWRARLIAQTECLPGYVTVSGANATAIYRRWYTGDLIEIETSLGYKFSGTPNHPMLTLRGWSALGLLTERDCVIGYGSGVESYRSRNPYIKDAPLTLAEIFRSVGAITRIEREVGSKQDFHGDGRQGEVDILRPDRILQVGDFAALDERSRYSGLSPTNYAEILSFARCYTLAKATGFTQCVPLGRQAERKSSLYEGPLKPLAIDAQFGRDTGKGLSVFIQVLRVLQVKRRAFAGHVYNLTTTDGYYVANGLLTGNTIRAYNRGAQQVYEASGVVKRKRWLDGQPGACPLCQALNGTVVNLKSNFAGGVDGPPRHPGCRCAIAGVIVGED